MTSNRNHALSTILRAVEERRLPHALLLKGRNLTALKHAAHEVSSLLLTCDVEKLNQHPDFFVLQARNKMRQISVDGTRELIRNIQHSPSAGDRKVALVMEVDRMNQESANAFLKTLEEPPLNTNIILTTVKPNALLPTIISRCLSFWFNEPEAPVEEAVWVEWKTRFQNWLHTLPNPPKQRKEITDRMMQLYGLLEGFQVALQSLADQRWEVEKAQLPEHMSDEEVIAMEVGMSKAIRTQLLAEMETSVRDFATELGREGPSESWDPVIGYRKLEESVGELEYLKGLLEVNLVENKMLEVFLLKLLRIWSSRT